MPKKWVKPIRNRIAYVSLFVSAFVAIWVLQYSIAGFDRMLAVILTMDLLVFLFYLLVFGRYMVQTIFSLVALSTGIYGYIVYPVKHYPVINAIYSTFRLFVIDVDYVFTTAEDKFARLPLSIDIARWSAAAYTISTIFMVVSKMMGHSLKLSLIRLTGGHIVISGFNMLSQPLIQHFREIGHKVIVLADDIPPSMQLMTKEWGAIVVPKDRVRNRLYRKIGLSKAKYMILLEQDDANNLNELISLKQYLEVSSLRKKPVFVLIHLFNQQSKILYEALEGEWKESKSTLPRNVRVCDVNQMIAEKLLNEHPLYVGYEERVRDPIGEGLHLLFIGFGALGRQVAMQAMERGHFFNKNKLSVTILDPAAEMYKKQWFQAYPQSERVADIAFHQVNIHADWLEQYVMKATPSVTHIYICMENSPNVLMEGISLSRALRDIPIYLQIQNEGHISRWLNQDTKQFHKLYRFGDSLDVMDSRHFINEEWNVLAEAYHETYRAMEEEEGRSLPKPWDRLDHMEKETNRALMNHAMTKLMLAGLNAVPADQFPDGYVAMTEEEYLDKIVGSLEKIAESEHYRWNAFHYLLGWDVFPEPTRDKRKDAASKLHSCLVPWEELDRVQELTGVDYKEYDRKFVRNLHRILTSGGYMLYQRN